MTAPVKAYLETEDGDSIPFLFNPDSIEVSRTVTWGSQESPGENAPKLTWGHGHSATMKITELWFDTTDTGAAVTVYTSKILKLTEVISPRTQPPWVRLQWGVMDSFKAVIESVTFTYVFFGSDGTPLRAKASINFKQFEDEHRHPLQNPTSGTRRRERMHQVKPGETLDRIAYTAYGDPTQWRVIARRNRIQDPMRLPPGMRLILPEREAASRGR